MRILDFTDGFESQTEPTQQDFPASQLVNTPSGNLEATNVQAALNELQTDIDTINDSVGVADGIATLDSNGKLPTSQLPSLSITEVYVVADITARDALTVQEGDVSKVLDDGSGNNATYIYDGSSWVELNNDGALATHEADTSTHGVTGNIVGDSDTQELSNKTFIDAPTFDEQVSTPATPASGKSKIYPKDNGKWYTLNDAGNETELGAGNGSGINYIENPDFESGLDNTGTDGSGNVTIALETSNPIRGSQSATISVNTAANPSQYAYMSMSPVDRIDYEGSKQMVVKFDYFTSAGYQNEDIEVYLRRLDATAADIAFSNGTGLIQASTSKTTFVGLVELDSDASNYELRFRSNGVSSTVSVTIDNVTLGPQGFYPGESTIVNEISLEGNDERAITSFTESVPFGTGEEPTGWTYGADGSTPTNGNYYTVQEDDSILEISVSVRLDVSYSVMYLVKNGVNWRLIDGASSGASEVKQGSYISVKGEFQKGDKIAFTAGSGKVVNSVATHYLNIREVKTISNLISTTEAFFKNASLIVGGTPTSTINSSFNDIVWPNVEQDRFNIYNNTTGEITIPESGFYFLTTTNEQTATSTSLGNTYGIRVYNKTKSEGITSSRMRPNSISAGLVLAPKITTFFEAEKGDKIVVQSQNDATSPSYITTYEGHQLALASFKDITSFGVVPVPELIEAELASTSYTIPVSTYGDLLYIDVPPGEWDFDCYAKYYFGSPAGTAGTIYIGVGDVSGNNYPLWGENGIYKVGDTYSANTNLYYKKGVIVTTTTRFYLKTYKTTAINDLNVTAGFSARRVK